MPCPIADWRPGSAFLTSLATVTVLAFGPLLTWRPMVSLPSVRVTVSAGTETSWTVPSCPTLTGVAGWPGAEAGTTVMFAIWSMLVRKPETCSGLVAEPCFSEPTDWTTVAC